MINRIPPPLVVWAQRRNIIYLTICLEDCKEPVIKIEPNYIYFRGVGGTERKAHQFTVNLFKEIDPNKTVQNLTGRTFELILFKKEVGPYWPRLTNEKVKCHWLKSDFNKWKDETDSDDSGKDEGSKRDLEEMMMQMGGLGGSGENKPGFDDFDDAEDCPEEEDSDDDYLPDLFQ